MKRQKVVLAVAAGMMFSLLGCEPSLKDNKEQYSYALGVQIAQNMQKQKVELDAKAFATGVKHVMEGKELKLTEEARMAAIREMSKGLQEAETKDAEVTMKEAQAYLETNKSREGVKTTESGLQYKVISEGKGKSPKEESTVEVHYRGRLINGTEFDSSYSRNQTATFPLNGVIRGWTEGLQLMKEGAKYELTVPPELGYGPRRMDQIPPNSALIFEVELIKVVK